MVPGLLPWVSSQHDEDSFGTGVDGATGLSLGDSGWEPEVSRSYVFMQTLESGDGFNDDSMNPLWCLKTEGRGVYWAPVGMMLKGCWTEMQCAGPGATMKNPKAGFQDKAMG